DHLVIGAAEAVLGDGVGLFGLRIEHRRHLGLAEARPDRRLRPEAVGQVDHLLAGDDAIGALEVALPLPLRLRGRDQRHGRDDTHAHADGQPAADDVAMTHRFLLQATPGRCDPVFQPGLYHRCLRSITRPDRHAGGRDPRLTVTTSRSRYLLLYGLASTYR